MYQSRAPWVKLISTTMMPILPTFFTHSNPLLLTVFYIQLVASLLGAAHASSGCDNPAQRKEWRMLSGAEKQSWVDAFNCLAELPHDASHSPTVLATDIPPVDESSSYYDDIVYLHMDLNHHVHFTGLFFPWHRWYVHQVEKALKTKCGYPGTMPYWDWTLDAPNFHDSSFWDDTFIGGWGQADHDDYGITTGGFATQMRAYPTPHHIRRQYTLRPFTDFPEFEPNPEKMANTSFTREEVDRLVNGYAGDFNGLQKDLESFEGMHSAVHNILGGDLKGACPESDIGRALYPDCSHGSKWSPNDPIFFLHHAMLDKVWSDWQHRRPENRMAFYGGSVKSIQNASIYEQYPNGAPPFLQLDSPVPGDGLWEGTTIGEVMETQGRYLCYVYV